MRSSCSTALTPFPFGPFKYPPSLPQNSFFLRISALPPTSPLQVKRMQRSWIGRSSGNLVTFNILPLPDSPARSLQLQPVVVFTTRVETIYGIVPSSAPPATWFSNHPLPRLHFRRTGARARDNSVADAHALHASVDNGLHHHASSIPPRAAITQHLGPPQPQAFPPPSAAGGPPSDRSAAAGFLRRLCAVECFIRHVGSL
jgi:hypothetical protein